MWACDSQSLAALVQGGVRTDMFFFIHFIRILLSVCLVCVCVLKEKEGVLQYSDPKIHYPQPTFWPAGVCSCVCVLVIVCMNACVSVGHWAKENQWY